MEIISESENDEFGGKAEFFYRYKSFLFLLCKKGCFHFIDGDQLANDIFQNSIMKAIGGISKFREKLDNETNIQSRIKSWLAVIARNELREFLRKNPDEIRLGERNQENSLEIEIEDSNEAEAEDSNPPSIKKIALDKGLETLSEKEKHILFTYMEFFDPKYPNRHLPDKVISQLSERYNVKSSTLRKTKGRALKKLANAIEKSNKIISQ